MVIQSTDGVVDWTKSNEVKMLIYFYNASQTLVTVNQN